MTWSTRWAGGTRWPPAVGSAQVARFLPILLEPVAALEVDVATGEGDEIGKVTRTGLGAVDARLDAVPAVGTDDTASSSVRRARPPLLVFKLGDSLLELLNGTSQLPELEVLLVGQPVVGALLLAGAVDKCAAFGLRPA